jgi:DNA-binding NarL/FixJ family response regulator
MSTIYHAFIFGDRYFDIEKIKGILAHVPEIEIIGDSNFRDDALKLVAQKIPDLIIVDADIAGDTMSALNFVKNMRKSLPHVLILGLTSQENLIISLKRTGCDDVLNKTLIENYKAVATYIHKTLIHKHLSPLYPRFSGNVTTDAPPPGGKKKKSGKKSKTTTPALTEEEFEVLRLICEGFTEGQIASSLGFTSRKPVRRIKSALFEKFNVINDNQLTKLVHDTGYFD